MFGLFKHYKGKYYLVVGIAKHTETLQELVVYRQLYGDFSLWVRPKDMFLSAVTISETNLVPRFSLVFGWIA